MEVKMITIITRASSDYNLNDLLRSLINNAEDKNNFQIIVDEKYKAIADTYKDIANIVYLENHETIELNTEIVWSISDEYIVMGHQWDKRINFYKEKFEDGVFVMLPSGYKSYNMISVNQTEEMAERNPIMSSKWVELAGIDNVEITCRDLFFKYGIDRRIDLRLVDLLARGRISSLEPYDTKEVEINADKIAEYIKTFTPRRN